MKTSHPETLSFSRKDLIAIIIPVILNELLTRAVNIIDSVMVSSVGEAAVSALSINTVTVILQESLTVLIVGNGVLLAQYSGAQDVSSGQNALRQSFWLTLFLAVPAALLLFPLSGAITALLFGNAEAAVQTGITLSLQMGFVELPFWMLGQLCNYALIAMGKTSHVLRLNLGKNLLNIGGNALFIYGLRWGLFGALLSTLLSHATFSILAIWLLHNKTFPLHFENLLHYRYDKRQSSLILRIGFSATLEKTLFRFGPLLTSVAIATLPAVAVAANSVAYNIVALGWALALSFATATGSVVGRCIGADQPEQARHYAKRLTLVGYGLSIAVFAVIFALRTPLVSIYALSPETKLMAADTLALGSILTIFAGHTVTCILVSTFRAAGDIRYTITTSLCGMFFLQVPVTLLGIYVLQLSTASIWIGMAVDWIFRCVLHMLHFRRGKWLAKKVI